MLDRRIVAVVVAFMLVVPAVVSADIVKTRVNQRGKAWQHVAEHDGPIEITASSGNPRVDLVILVTDFNGDFWCASVGIEQLAKCSFYALEDVRYTIIVASLTRPTRVQINITGGGPSPMLRAPILEQPVPAEATERLERLREAAGG